MINDNMPLEEFRKISSMTARCYNCCAGIGIKTFGDFMDYVFTSNIRNMGNSTIQEIISLKSKYKDERCINDNNGIDWEKVRIKAAISALQGFAASPQIASTDTLARWSVCAADTLIAELKKGGLNYDK